MSAANQDASINKNSKSSNSRSLKQHTLAKSISLCCFCFCSAREIDRFIIRICRYLSHQFDKILNKILNKILIKILILVAYIYLSSSRTFFAFEFIFSRLSHLLWAFLFLSWSDWYLSHRQWISSQCRSIEEVIYSFRNEVWKRRKNSVTSMSEISIGDLSYQRKFIWELARSKAWRSQSTSGIRLSVHICSLDQIFSFCYLLFF